MVLLTGFRRASDGQNVEGLRARKGSIQEDSACVFEMEVMMEVTGSRVGEGYCRLRMG